MTHICVSKQTIFGSDSGLSPGRRQAIIQTNAGLLLICPYGIIFNEISIENHTFIFIQKYIIIQENLMSSAKWRPFCFGLSVLTVLQFMSFCEEATVSRYLDLWHLITDVTVWIGVFICIQQTFHNIKARLWGSFEMFLFIGFPWGNGTIW